MIHYHGVPITPNRAAATVLASRHACVSFACPTQLPIVEEVASSFMLDNGAFSAWRAGKPTDWPAYYEWVCAHRDHPGFDFAIIPDKIDGTEEDNDKLIQEWPFEYKGVPVWHLHESFNRLQDLCESWPRVALGSSGEYSSPGSANWWVRMKRAMETACNPDGVPVTRLHGLRMLNPAIFTKLPLSSADSCNVGRNIGIDRAWTGTYQPPTKEWRALILAARIESHQSAARWQWSEALAMRGG